MDVLVMLVILSAAVTAVVGLSAVACRVLEACDVRRELRRQARDRHPSGRAQRVAETLLDPALTDPDSYDQDAPEYPERRVDVSADEAALLGRMVGEMPQTAHLTAAWVAGNTEPQVWAR